MDLFHSYVKLPEGNQHFNLGCAKLSGFLRPKRRLGDCSGGFFNAQARLGDVRLGDGIKRGLF